MAISSMRFLGFNFNGKTPGAVEKNGKTYEASEHHGTVGPHVEPKKSEKYLKFQAKDNEFNA